MNPGRHYNASDTIPGPFSAEMRRALLNEPQRQPGKPQRLPSEPQRLLNEPRDVLNEPRDLPSEPQRGSPMSSPGCSEAEPGVTTATNLNRSAVRQCCLHSPPRIDLPRCSSPPVPPVLGNE